MLVKKSLTMSTKHRFTTNDATRHSTINMQRIIRNKKTDVKYFFPLINLVHSPRYFQYPFLYHSLNELEY